MQFLEHKSCGILTRTVWSVVVRHVVLAIHIVHSLETNGAGPISRQILVLSEHKIFTLKGKGTWNIQILYCKSLDYALFVSLPHGAMPGWPAVCDCGISWPYSIIFETIIIVDDNTIVFNNIRLNYKSTLAKQVKNHPRTRDESH